MIGSKFSRHFFNQSEVKPKPIVAHACTFFRALCRLRGITSSFDWFAGLTQSFLIGQVTTLVLVLRHSIETRSITFPLFHKFENLIPLIFPNLRQPSRFHAISSIDMLCLLHSLSVTPGKVSCLNYKSANFVLI